MAVRIKDNIWKCNYCEETFPTVEKANAHRDSTHDIVYIPLMRSDLNKLLAYIFTRDDRVLTKTLVSTLQLYNANSAKKQESIQ